MTDHQRIHPVSADPEAPPPHPTAPLVPRSSFRSDKGDPDHRHQPPPHTYPPSPYPSPRKRRNCCCRCLCWILCLILAIVVIIGILTAITFLVFRPKLPKYSIESLRITQFNLTDDMSLYATFNVNITARNPNKKIGIYYEGGSHLNVFFKGIELCEGPLPKFYQGHRNVTVMNVNLKGQTNNATGLFQSLLEQQQTGSVPLNLRAKVPVRIKVGKLKLMKWKFLVKCWLDVDRLSAANDAIRIRDSNCKFRFRL